MATLERPAPLSAEPHLDRPASFDPTAVPVGPNALAHLVAGQHAPSQQDQGQQDDDLVELGQEQLFAGTRTRGPAGASQERVEQQSLSAGDGPRQLERSPEGSQVRTKATQTPACCRR